MPLTPEFRAFVSDLFACIGPVGFKRAFGLDAIIAEGVMVGFLLESRIHLRTDPETRPLYEAEGGQPFTFMKGKELIVTSYLTMPERLYDDPDELAIWARRALEAALQSPTAVKRRAKQAKAASRKGSKRMEEPAQQRKAAKRSVAKDRKPGKVRSRSERSSGRGRRS